MIDRELYLPRGWLADAERCQVAGVPDRVGLATKPKLARVMLDRALEAGVPAGWVTCRWLPWSRSPEPAGGSRRRLQAGKGLCGLDQPRSRRWRSWYRWVTLALLASAFLVVAAATQHARHPPPLGLIPLTCNELQHLFATLVVAPSPTAPTGCAGRGGDADTRRARTCHYRRQATWDP